jgi:hypothetical protein
VNVRSWLDLRIHPVALHIAARCTVSNVKWRILLPLGVSIMLLSVLVALLLPASCPRMPPSGPGNQQCAKDHHVTLRVLIGATGLLVAYGLVAPAVILAREDRRRKGIRSSSGR